MDLSTIWPWGQKDSPEIKRRYREQFLERLKRDIDQRLQLIHHSSLLNPGLRDQSHAGSIGELLDHPDHRGIALLGESGSGKSTKLLLITRELIEQAEVDPKQPLPVPLDLATWSWDDHAERSFWAADQSDIDNASKPVEQVIHESNPTKSSDLPQLMSRHLRMGLKVELSRAMQVDHAIPRQVAQAWYKEGGLLPIIDNIDGFDSEKCQRCASILKQHLEIHANHQLVLGCQPEIFDEMRSDLEDHLQVLELALLTIEQIKSYLQASSHSDLWQAIQADPHLQNWARSPLWLSLLAQTYQGQPITDERSVFEGYLRSQWRRTEEQASQYSWEYSLRVLSFMAKRMQQFSVSEFLIESIPPQWLTQPIHRQIYQCTLGLSGGLCGISLGLLLLPDGLFLSPAPINWIAYAILLVITLFGLNRGIRTVKASFRSLPRVPKTFRFTFAALRRTTIKGILIGLLGICLIWLLTQIPSEEPQPVSFYTLLYAMAGLMGLLSSYAFEYGSLMPAGQSPNRAIWETLKCKSPYYVTTILILLVFLLLDQSIANIASVLLFFTVSLSPLGTLASHLLIRILLYKDGSLPWDLAEFLNEAADRGLILRQGGRYRFVHEHLRDYLASL